MLVYGQIQIPFQNQLEFYSLEAGQQTNPILAQQCCTIVILEGRSQEDATESENPNGQVPAGHCRGVGNHRQTKEKPRSCC